ncbi:tetratricopeptide repeat protein [Arthrospiribacter ruber]|uniref:Tetratricopeptide repeat protein n=1 Tax=Arthrospiribacter ruber TaxID=2487934 RepID=A0A951IXP6_9BACT|nr:tetratricopeptide repeat protein [Arthrospiribacter ruber]MBW3467957.1 tetratricopeptide repeat protein [Arthrospiribacter ruber]
MSKMSRLEMIKSFAEQEPNNPFNWYALALEYKELEPQKAGEYFIKLLQEFPEYLPTYFQAANFFAESEQLQTAKETFLKGISLAKQQNDSNTLRELKNSYSNFVFEYDIEED